MTFLFASLSSDVPRSEGSVPERLHPEQGSHVPRHREGRVERVPPPRTNAYPTY